MSAKKITPLNPLFWVLLRISLTSSANAKLRTWSITQGISSHQFVSSFHSFIPSKPISHFLWKSIPFGNRVVRNPPPPPTDLGFLRNPNLFSHRLVSSSSDQQSFTVLYLINSVGLSPETALSASKYVNFETPEKADRVINLFKKYGFTQTQVSSLVRRRPTILLLDAEKIIFPKLEFLEAKGITHVEMAKMLSSFPTFLASALANQIVPSFNFFRDFFQSEEKVIVAVKVFPDILIHNFEKFVAPKIDILREHGMPDFNITKLVLYNPRVFTFSLDRFRENVEEVVKIGFNTSKVTFVEAVHVFMSISKSTWESKVDAYKKWGWSQDDVLKAFRRSPRCMMISQDKIKASMGFFINQMSSSPCFIAKHPNLLSLSVKRRLIPRSLIFQVLVSKGLVKKEIGLLVLFSSPERKFLEKFVTPYEKEAPEVLKLYEEKCNLSNGLLVDKV